MTIGHFDLDIGKTRRAHNILCVQTAHVSQNNIIVDKMLVQGWEFIRHLVYQSKCALTNYNVCILNETGYTGREW